MMNPAHGSRCPRFTPIAILAVVALLVPLYGCDQLTNLVGTTGGTVAVTGVTLDEASLALTVGGSHQLNATVAPANATDTAISWTSSNTNFATVNAGNVTAIAAGTATITVRAAGGAFTDTCTVTVTENTDPPGNAISSDFTGATIAGYAVAKDSVLRSIPTNYINTARTTYHVAYNHTSHGTHVSYGLYGLPGFKAGDDTLFAVSNSDAANALDFSDAYNGGGIGNDGKGHAYPDLSQTDNASDWAGWIVQNETFLDDPTNADVNVIMWSWCDIFNHNVSDGDASTLDYLSSMQTLIDEYGAGGTKIGATIGAGVTRTTPVTFIFMTGHGNPDANTGDLQPKTQAKKIIDYCNANGYYCLDYYTIDTHTMDDVYYEDTGDTGNSDDYVTAYNELNDPDSSGSFYHDWQEAHTLGVDWFYSRSAPGGAAEVGQHNDISGQEQYITANRKGMAFWWILARMAGWDPSE